MSKLFLVPILTALLTASGCATFIDQMGDVSATPGDDDTGDDDTGDDDTGDDDTTPVPITCGPYDFVEGEIHTVILTGTAHGPVPPTCIHYVGSSADEFGEQVHSRFVHGAATGPDVDVYVDGTLVPSWSGLQPGQASPDPADGTFGEFFPAGKHQIEVFTAGADPLLDDPLVNPVAAEYGDDAYHTLFLSGPPGQRLLRGAVHEMGPTAEGNGRLDFIHTMEDLPVVDVTLAPVEILLWDGLLLGFHGHAWEIPAPPMPSFELVITEAS